MKATPELAWNAIRDYYLSNKDVRFEDVSFDNQSKDNFVNIFKTKYKEIKSQYMAEKTGDLDRHKQAAILLYCTVESKMFKSKQKLNPQQLFIANEQIGLLLSLSYMKNMLNDILNEIGEPIIEKYIFPRAFSCDTEYFDIITRDIYLQGNDGSGIYILFLSNILYFIEYNTLREINPELIDKIRQYMAEKDDNESC